MTAIVPISGRVKFPITLDPSSWIFDDRKIDIHDFFTEGFDLEAFLTEQADERAGLAMPKLASGRRRYKKDDWLKASFVMPAKLFIETSEPEDGADTLSLENDQGVVQSLPMEEAKLGVFAFSIDGKVITDEGPLHFYHADPSKRQAPIKGIAKIVIK